MAQGTAPATETRDTVIHIGREFLINTDSIIHNGSNKKPWPQIDLSTDVIKSVDIVGRASIDGPLSTNNRLARERAEKMQSIVEEQYEVPASAINLSSIGEDWNLFRALVVEDEAIPYRNELLKIIDTKASHNSKEEYIRKMKSGVTWKYLSANVLPKMRYASVAMHVTSTYSLPEKEPEIVVEEIVEPPVVVEEEIIEEIIEEEPEEWVRKMYIKTNAPAWALLLQNAAVEVDLAKHWSFSLPVYWSPYNYGTETLKFRTLAFIPEFRFWPKADNTGFFVNAHFGLAYYNYAKNGEYRYQDHEGKTPAIGGGIGLGYRFYFCRNHHWSMEVAVGAGIYKLDYDIFLNRKNINAGYLVGREQRTFYGIDQAAVTFSYSFGLNRKKAAQEGGDK